MIGNILGDLWGRITRQADKKFHRGELVYQQGLQHQTMDKSFDLNSQMMQHQANLNHAQWAKQFNIQNTYNDPGAQLKRIKDAGLNAALMYGRTGLTNSNAMGAGAGSGMGSLQTGSIGHEQSRAAIQGDLAGDILKYQEAKRSPQRDALTKWQAAIEAEKAISQKINNEEIRQFIEYYDDTNYRFFIDKDHRVRLHSLKITSSFDKDPKKLTALGTKTSLAYRKQELENLLNDALETMQSMKNTWARLGVDPSKDSTVLSLLTVMQKAGMSEKEMINALAAYNIFGEVAKNLLNRLNLFKGGVNMKGRSGTKKTGPPLDKPKLPYGRTPSYLKKYAYPNR